MYGKLGLVRCVMRIIHRCGAPHDQGLALGILGFAALPVLGVALYLSSFVKEYWSNYVVTALLVYSQAFAYNYLYQADYIHGFFLFSSVMACLFLPAIQFLKAGVSCNDKDDDFNALAFKLGSALLLLVPALVFINHA